MEMPPKWIPLLIIINSVRTKMKSGEVYHKAPRSRSGSMIAFSLR